MSHDKQCPVCEESRERIRTGGMVEPESREWHWYQVRFDLGIQGEPDGDWPDDPIDFLKSLLDDRIKYVGPPTIDSARLTTVPA